MFKVRNKYTNEIVQVLDTYFDDMYHQTYFFLWENDGWRWRSARKYIPPNYVIEEKEESNE